MVVVMVVVVVVVVVASVEWSLSECIYERGVGGCGLCGRRYVMSEEMSSASATYAQWLDDSTQVSAKDLVTYFHV